VSAGGEGRGGAFAGDTADTRKCTAPAEASIGFPLVLLGKAVLAEFVCALRSLPARCCPRYKPARILPPDPANRGR